MAIECAKPHKLAEIVTVMILVSIRRCCFVCDNLTVNIITNHSVLQDPKGNAVIMEFKLSGHVDGKIISNQIARLVDGFEHLLDEHFKPIGNILQTAFEQVFEQVFEHYKQLRNEDVASTLTDHWLLVDGVKVGPLTKFVMAPEHVPTFREQMLSLREKLAVEVLMVLPADQEWLDLVAKSIAHSDWHTFENEMSELNSEFLVVLAGPNVTTLAYNLRNQLASPRISIDRMMDLITAVGTESERYLNYRIAGVEEIKDEDITFTLHFGPEQVYGLPLLEWLWPNWGAGGRDEQNILLEYCEHMKRSRRGLGAEEIKQRGLDVYNAKGVKAKDVLNELVKDGYVWRDEVTHKVRITELGCSTIEEMLTDDFGPDWQSWWRSFYPLMNSVPYKRIDEDWSHYIKAFSEGITPENAVKSSRLGWGEFATECNDLIRESILKQHGCSLDLYPNERFFFFFPRIYTDPRLMTTRLSEFKLEFDGPDWAKPQFPLKAKRYWPNKRYVASQVIDGSTGKDHSRGWFVQIPDGIEEFEFTFHWRCDGKFPPVSHTFSVTLEEDKLDARNWLYLLHRDYSLHSTFAFTEGRVDVTDEEIVKHDRFMEGIERIEITKHRVLIKESRSVVAANPYQCEVVLL